MYGALLLLSEITLAAYPLLIKLTNASVTFQVGLRMFTYTALAALVSYYANLPFDTSILFSKETIATGALNLAHVASSYVGFDQLTAGNAMSLFYTYPVWNLLGTALVFGESIPIASLPWIGLALGGAILLAQPSAKDWTLVGVVAALLAAITETGIYLWFKSKGETSESDEPWTKMMQMYGGSLVLWIVGIVFALFVGLVTLKTFQISSKGLQGILLFNTFIGFLGYALRFYIIPKVSTITFSSLSFFGIVAAYALGWIFMGETANTMQLAGAGAIILANAALLRKEIA